MIRSRSLKLVIVLLLIAAGAAAQPPLFQALVEDWPLAGPGHVGKRLAASLDLTAEQQAAVEALREELAEASAPLAATHREEMEAIRGLLEAGGADPTDLGERMIAAHETRRQLQALHEVYRARFSALLDAQQLATFQELQAGRRQREIGLAFGPR